MFAGDLVQQPVAAEGGVADDYVDPVEEDGALVGDVDVAAAGVLVDQGGGGEEGLLVALDEVRDEAAQGGLLFGGQAGEGGALQQLFDGGAPCGCSAVAHSGGEPLVDVGGWTLILVGAQSMGSRQAL